MSFKEEPSIPELRDSTSPERSPEEILKAAASFDELYEALHQVGHITTSLRTFTPEEVIEIINDFRKGNKGITFITKTHNLREIVMKLLPKDPSWPKKTD